MSEDFAAGKERPGQPAGASELLARLYREIGLLAIAAELDIELDDSDTPPVAATQAGRRELAA